MTTEEYNIRLKDGRTYTLAELEQAGSSYVLSYPDQPITKGIAGTLHKRHQKCVTRHSERFFTTNEAHIHE